MECFYLGLNSIASLSRIRAMFTFLPSLSLVAGIDKSFVSLYKEKLCKYLSRVRLELNHPFSTLHNKTVMMFIYNCYAFSNVFESLLPRVMPQKKLFIQRPCSFALSMKHSTPFYHAFSVPDTFSEASFYKHIIEKQYIRTYPTDSSCTFPSPAPRNHPSK